MSDFVESFSLIETAQTFQQAITDEPFLRRIELAKSALAILGRQAAAQDEINGRFMVDTRSAVGIPEQKRQPKVQLVIFGGVSIEGRLNDFSYVSIGTIGSFIVRSLCADFNEVTMLPDGDLLPDNMTLHIPVLAVEQSLRFA